MPLTTYYFANAADGTAGGASFTTDSTGLGPGDSANWSGSTYFNGTYGWWAGQGTTSSTQWADPGPSNRNCIDWTYSSAGGHGYSGTTASTTATRWTNLWNGNCTNLLSSCLFR